MNSLSILQSVAIAISTAFAAVLSTVAVMRGQSRQAEQADETNNTAQIQTIFDGYSQIVSDLHAEVKRLHDVVDELYKEQEACEERNSVLESEITDLMTRICKLEEQKNV
jgi:peptidoglycan hydrolase CwlO-like protein